MNTMIRAIGIFIGKVVIGILKITGNIGILLLFSAVFAAALFGIGSIIGLITGVILCGLFPSTLMINSLMGTSYCHVAGFGFSCFALGFVAISLLRAICIEVTKNIRMAWKESLDKSKVKEELNKMIGA